MNKKDLVNKVSEVLKSKKNSQLAVESVFKAIEGALKKKDSVTIIGFGTFKVEERKARKGRNPRTGAPITIKARKVPKFVPGKGLKEAVQ